MRATPGETGADVSRPAGSPPDSAVERLANGWLLLRRSRLATEGCLVLIQPGTGVGLLELEPSWTPGMVGRFHALLDSSDFGAVHPGHLPVIHRRLRPADIEFLPTIMEEAFLWQDPISIEAAPVSWESMLVGLLLASSSPRTAPTMDAALPGRDAVSEGAAPDPSGMEASPSTGSGDHPNARSKAEAGRISGRPGRGRPLILLAAIGLIAVAAVMVVLDQEHRASGMETARLIAPPAGVTRILAADASVAAQPPAAEVLVTSPAPAAQDPDLTDARPARVIQDREEVAVAAVPEPRVVAEVEAAPAQPPTAAAAEAPEPPALAAAENAPAPPVGAAPEPAQEPALVAAPEALPDAPVTATVEDAPLPIATEPPPPPSEPRTMATPSPPPGAMAANAVPDRAVSGEPAVGPGQITVLLRRGKALLAIGDISGARRFFERAAVGGSAAAARAIAETYDPRILAEQPAFGLMPDQAAALAWYRRAAALGAGQEEVGPAIARLEAGR